MKLQLVFLAIFGRSVIHLAHSVVNGNCPCTTPQYLEYGKKGTITCNFTSAIDVIHWYDTNDTLHNPPVISWNKKSEDEIGYAIGGYEIQPNGSLLIKDTLSEGDLYFSVVMLYNEQIACEKNIHVVVFVKTHQSSYLAIDKCGSTRYCYRHVDRGIPLQLSCHLNGAVLSRAMRWELWTSGEPRIIPPAGRTVIAGNVGEATNMSLILPFTGQRLDVLVCKMEDNFAYEVKCSTILVEWIHNNSDTHYAPITPINKMVELKSSVRLDCGGSKRISFVWKMCFSKNKYNCSEIMHFALGNRIFLENGFSADNSGTLIVEEVKTHHEGWYWCYSSNGRNNTERFYRVDVYAMPVPLKPIVAECDDEDLCQIESGLKGNITCSLFGVRPEASLEWVVISVPLSTVISFTKTEQKVISHEGVYDISIKTLYHVESLQFSEIDLECRAILIMSSLSTTVQLSLSDLITSGARNHQRPYCLWILTSLTLLSLTACAIIIYCKKRYRNRRRGESNQLEEVERTLNIVRNTNEQGHSEKDFRLSLSTLKVNIARNLRGEDALRLSSMFKLGKDEKNTISSSKNPAVALIDLLLNGDGKTVNYNLSELERISKKCDMTEVNQLLNSFVRNRFREAFCLKVNIMKNGELANKEEERLLHKMIWDYSKLKDISDLGTFFEENYNTTISFVQEGSLDLWVKMPPTELLDILWMDIQSGMLAIKICPIVMNNIQLGCSHYNSLELKISCDTNAGKRIKEMITKRDHAAKERRNDVNDQHESHEKRYGKAEASESPKTVLTEMITTISLQMANYIGYQEASDLCNCFKLSQELSEQILSSHNPGLEVIISLIKRDRNSLEGIINDLNVAAGKISRQEVKNFLLKFERNILKNQASADNVENEFFRPNNVTIEAIAQIWQLFFRFAKSAAFNFIGWNESKWPILNRDKKTLPISKRSFVTKQKATQKDDKLDGSVPDLQSIHQLFYEILSEMKIEECQRSFSEYDVFLLNLAVKNIGKWKKNCVVDAYKTRWRRIVTVILTVCELLLPITIQVFFKAGDGLIWAWFPLIIAILYFPFTYQSIFIEGVKAMRMDLSPLLTKLITVIRTVDQMTINVVKASLIKDKLDTLSQVYTEKQLSNTTCGLKGQLQLCKQQEIRHSTSLVEIVQESLQIITATCEVIQDFYATVNDDHSQISSDALNLDDAITYIANNTNMFPPSLVQFLLTFYGLVDRSPYKSDRSIEDHLIPQVEHREKGSSGRQSLSLQSLTTSMVAMAIPQNSLQDMPSTEMSSDDAQNGVVLKNSGIYISFGYIGGKVVAICEDFLVEPSFIFEELQHQMLVLKEMCTSVDTR